MMARFISKTLVVILLIFLVASCNMSMENSKPRLSMFIGVDISGSFKNTKYFDDSLDFLAHYIYSHMNGLGGTRCTECVVCQFDWRCKGKRTKNIFSNSEF